MGTNEYSMGWQFHSPVRPFHPLLLFLLLTPMPSHAIQLITSNHMMLLSLLDCIPEIVRIERTTILTLPRPIVQLY